ncbi:hypothetical protein [Magnetospirillum molischianum]|uniref:Uncharacterized protein n=1 Tax=Magnetospirillum molischianum DSM 120 TaxID=1150626 RepID=H8FN82_MAGML|nr:hypothetical protein [Magnetospirillum molischianum]CCG39820.1 conserved exported hypothetical protein [Magnetospirillum molischianum DSM 120]
MTLSVQDITVAAIVSMALVGAFILFSAWRYALRIERAAEKNDDDKELSPAT